MTTISSATTAPTTSAPTTSAPTTSAAASSPERARLHQAAQQFEAIFVRQMLSSARAANFGDTLWGDDQGNQTFTAMRDERFADLTAQSGTLGLAKQVEAQLAGRLAPAQPARAPATGGTRP
jgi:flagellar protein FlgJ